MRRVPNVIAWVAEALLLAVIVWLITVFVRVRRLRKAYRRILNEPVARWIPPVGTVPRGRADVDLTHIDWRALSDEVNNDGVYVLDYDAVGQRGVGGKQINPANVAVFGIRRARRYVESGDRNDLALALRQFEFVEKAARPVRDTVVWHAEYDLAYEYGARAPWTGCYFQNFCMSALVWAHVLTGESRYLDLAHKSIGAFELAVADGGVAFQTPNGGLFFEEVAAAPLHHILNGHFIALLGLYRFFEFTGSEHAKRLFDRGVAGALDMLPRYDRNGYSLYSLSPHPPGVRNHFHIANPSYHHKHIALLDATFEITAEPALREYADRWRNGSGSLFDLTWTTMFVLFKDVMKAAKKTAGVIRS